MRYRIGSRWVAICIVFSLLLELMAFVQPSYALAEQVDADSQEDSIGGVIDAPGYAVDGIKWSLSKEGVLRIYSEDEDRSLYFEREALPWNSYCPQVKKVVIGPGITTLASNVFEGYTSLESVEFCEGIVEIYNSCFKNCISLTEVTFPESLQQINSSAFSDCTSLITVDLPDSVKEIGSSVFENCTSLTTVNLPNQMQKIGDRAFSGCHHLKTVNFPEKLGWMGAGIFGGCKALKAFRVPDGLTILPETMFAGCDNLREIIFPETLAKIERSAFNYAKGLTSVHFPASVKQISSGAFHYCEKLSALYFDGNAPEIAESVFYDVEAVAFYPSDDATWTEEVMQNYGGTIQWISWNPATGETGATLISDGDVALSWDQLPCPLSGVRYPEITVVCEGKKLVPGTDYDLIRWGQDSDIPLQMYPGIYEIKIVGKGEYCGTVKKYYEVVKIDPKLQFASSYVEKQTDSPSFINELTGVGARIVTCTYTSSDPAIASVDSSGCVTIHAAGVVDITVNSRGNTLWEEDSASYRLNISEPPEPTPAATPEPTVPPTKPPTPAATPEPTVSPTKPPEPTPAATPTPASLETAVPTETLPPTPVPVEVPKTTEKAPGYLVQATTPPDRLDSAPSSSPGKAVTAVSRQKRGKLPRPHIVLKKGKSKTGMRYIKIKVKGYKGKYVQIYLRQKNKKYRRIKLASSVLKRKKSFKLAYTHRKVLLWFRVRTYSKQGGKRIYSPYSKAKRVML